MTSAVVDQRARVQVQIGLQLAGELGETLDADPPALAVEPDRIAGHLHHAGQSPAGLVAVTILQRLPTDDPTPLARVFAFLEGQMYSTQFACTFDIGSAENVERAKTIRDELEKHLAQVGEETIGFEMEPLHAQRSNVLFLYSEDHGEPDHVIRFVLLCAEAFHLTGSWGFRWALTCSRPQPDGFGGGAHVLDLGRRKTLSFIDCETWLQAQLSPEPVQEKLVL